jgi:hypothetical protein
MQRMGPSLRALRENLSILLDVRVYDRLQAADPLCSGNFNWGAAAFAVGAPALVILLRTEPGLRRLSIGIALSLLSVLTLVELDPWNARFVLFFPVLTSLALARLWERHRWAAAMGAVALAMGFVSSAVPEQLQQTGVARLASQPWRDRSFRPPPVVPDDGSPIAYLCRDFGSAYLLYGPAMSRRVLYFPREEGFLRTLERERVRVVYVDGSLRSRSPVVEEAVRAGRLSPVAGSDWTGYVVR